MLKNLQNKIKNKKSIISIVGLGYVGLPLAFSFLNKKFKVIGIDSDKNKIKLLKSGKSYIKQFSNSDVKKALKKSFILSDNYSSISLSDVIIYCLPTPLSNKNKPEMKYIRSSLNYSKKYFKNGQAIILESTTYPGTTEEFFIPILKKFDIGKNIFLIYSPEREDPGNKRYNVTNIPKIVSGYSNNCIKIAKQLYGSLNKNQTIEVSSIKAAELTKLLENIYRSVNIGLINEMKLIAKKMDIDIMEVINAAKTKPFGYKAFYPGPGLGGHCIPIDPFILTWKAKQFGVDTKFIKLSGQINSFMPKYVVKNTYESLKNLKRKKILILGIAYKKNVDDIRESPALEIIKLFKKKGCIVSYSDPYVPKMPNTRKYNFQLKSVKLNTTNLKKFDACVLVTDHDIFNYNLIKRSSKIIIDCRGKYIASKNIIRS
tara:strand:- start:54 stop:1340 length:1287 start_codon:yes stop_codon:yes gene_type:complete